LASVETKSIFEIYAGKILTNIRKELFGWTAKSGPCKGCSVPDLSSILDENKRKEILKFV
jgi:hypothetical protein